MPMHLERFLVVAKARREEVKTDKKEELTYIEKGHIQKTVKLPVEIRPDAVKATLKKRHPGSDLAEG